MIELLLPDAAAVPPASRARTSKHVNNQKLILAGEAGPKYFVNKPIIDIHLHTNTLCAWDAR
jgi:hypothetical protein